MGIFGFLHISEISDKWVDHPKNFLKIGQRFRLKILSKNNARMSLKLSRKQVDLDHRKEITIQG
jgi:ribosomal protein S1